MRTMMILALLASPTAALAQEPIPLMSQRVQATPPAPWPNAMDDGLNDPAWHPALPGAPAVKSAQVGVRLDVGPRGFITRCTVTKPSRHAELNEESCYQLVFSRIQPARDTADRPMPATFDTAFRWRLGNPAPPPMVAVPAPDLPVPPPAEPPIQSRALWPLPSSDSWTVDPSPRGSAQSWITNDDYPWAALRAEQQGTVWFMLLIDAAGVPLDCIPTSTSGSQLLDHYTCELLMTRARFNPARNRHGILVPSTFRSRVRWELPSD